MSVTSIVCLPLPASEPGRRDSSSPRPFVTLARSHVRSPAACLRKSAVHTRFVWDDPQVARIEAPQLVAGVLRDAIHFAGEAQLLPGLANYSGSVRAS